MESLRHPGIATRCLLSLTLLAWLCVMSLAPPGFMPDWAGGSLRIVACPDAVMAPPSELMAAPIGKEMVGKAHRHPTNDGSGNHARHMTCPYAAAGLLTLANGLTPVLAVAFVVLVASYDRPLATIIAGVRRERPPSRGPPTLV